MWIMLIEKLPTEPSPPKLSIFWSTDASDSNKSISQFDRNFKQTAYRSDIFEDGEVRNVFTHDSNEKPLSHKMLMTKKVSYMKQQGDVIDTDFGAEDNWAKSRYIVYGDEQIRVFSREYSEMKPESMYDYLGISENVDHASHTLVSGSIAMNDRLDEIEDGHLKEIRDAALVDGCTYDKAVAMALGLDVTTMSNDEINLPVSGWYRIRPEYGLIYCDPHELIGSYD